MNRILGKLGTIVLITALVLTTTSMIMTTNVARAQPVAPSFWAEPTAVNFDTNNASIGTLFNVTIWAACLNFTFTWQVQLSFNASLLQEVNYGYTAGSTSELFAGHATIPVSAVADNVGGTFLLGESLNAADYINATSNSLFWIEFNVTAAPTTGQTLTCNIDPGYGAQSSIDNTYILYTMAYASEAEEGPLSTAFSTYSFAYATAVPITINSAIYVPSTVDDSVQVTVSANVTGGVGGVENATLYYATDNATFTSVPMTLNDTTLLWDGIIPGEPAGTTVSYYITAFDTAGNSAPVYNASGENYSYTVVPEFALLMLLVLFAASAAILVISKKSKRIVPK